MAILNDQIARMDDARMRFIEALNDHCHTLRDELRLSELLMHSVVRSLSVQTDTMAQLDTELQSLREEGPLHKPYVNDQRRQDIALQIEDTLKKAVKDYNNGLDKR